MILRTFTFVGYSVQIYGIFVRHVRTVGNICTRVETHILGRQGVKKLHFNLNVLGCLSSRKYARLAFFCFPTDLIVLKRS
jgi:hypothetical protein